ncbi:hypothetical protein SLS63_013055 [Diaporthe eres]|uniref:Secreted protein n=1 Tax=Diaporthe eres TaxID=83184 RepID=A0ABR1NPL5_DIAER
MADRSGVSYVLTFLKTMSCSAALTELTGSVISQCSDPLRGKLHGLSIFTFSLPIVLSFSLKIKPQIRATTTAVAKLAVFAWAKNVSSPTAEA